MNYEPLNGFAHLPDFIILRDILVVAKDLSPQLVDPLPAPGQLLLKWLRVSRLSRPSVSGNEQLCPSINIVPLSCARLRNAQAPTNVNCRDNVTWDCERR